MKKVLILLLAVIPIFALAQGNGGQAAENSFSKIEYMGYSNNIYLVKLTNKQSCTIPITVQWATSDSTFTIAAGASITVSLPGLRAGNYLIKSKPQTRCDGGGDMGWLEIWSPVSLPIKFKSLSIKRSSNILEVTFSVEDAQRIDHFNVKASRDGKSFQTVTIILPDNLSTTAVYTVKIDLSKVKY